MKILDNFDEFKSLRQNINDILLPIHDLGYETIFYKTSNTPYIRIYIKPISDMSGDRINFKPNYHFVYSLQHLVSYIRTEGFHIVIEACESPSSSITYKFIELEDLHNITKYTIQYIYIKIIEWNI